MTHPAIVIVAYQGLQPLDAIGPYEVFAGASRVVARDGVAAATTPVMIIGLDTASAPPAIRVPALLLGSAAYGLALAWAGVRVAAGEAEVKLPELCQTAIQSTP